MSDPALDALAESARNRGLKLVRSRVRTEGKPGFGKVGLTDASGKPVFGIDGKGPTAGPDAAAEYLRTLAVGDWGASLDAPAPTSKPPLKRQARSSAARPARQPAAAAPRPPKVARPLVRAATKSDAAAAAALIGLLEHDVDADGVGRRISALVKDGLAPLMATLEEEVVGLCGIDRMTVVHRDHSVGRITILVVAERARARGIGRLLLTAAEEELRKQGCGLVEVTSNDRLAEAHAFYRHMGYERTSIRFSKEL